MRGLRWLGGWVCVGLVLGVFGTPPSAQAVEDQETVANQPIGIPEVPRRLLMGLPETPTGREMKVGIFEVHPSFKTAVRHDDNIFLAPSAEEEDWIFTQTPAVEAHVKAGDHHFQAGYAAEIANFADNGEENSVNHLAFGQMDLLFNDLSFMASHGFEDTTSRHFTETSARDDLQINATNVSARYDRPKWAAEGGYVHNDLNHTKVLFDSSDFTEDIFTLLGGYKIAPKTLLLVEGDIGMVDYDREVDNSDQDYFQVFGGMRGELTPKSTLTAKLGYQGRDVDDLAGVGAQKDFGGFVADVDLQYQPRKETAFDLVYYRTVRNSTFETNNWFRQDKVSVGLRQRFLRKWIFNPVFSWQQHSYPDAATRAGVTKDREDDFLQVETGLRYEIQDWLSTGVAYNFRERNSNLDVFDYDNNLVTFDVTSVF